MQKMFGTGRLRLVALAAVLAVSASGMGLAQTAPGGLGAAQPKPEPPLQPSGTPTTLTEVVAGQNQMPFLQSNSDQLLREYEAKYRAIMAQGGFPQVPNGTYKKGDKGGAIGTLNQRLYAEGYLRVEGTQGQFAQLYTSATQDAVARFQRNHGLAVTGKVDANTVAELNVSADKRLATIDANIPRLATYEEGLGDRYIVVNVPAQQLEAVTGGRVYERHNVIVGRPARPTPVVMTGIETVKFNPYWNAPSSIVAKDILPKLQHGTDYLTQLNIKIFQGGPNGPEVDPKTLNFSTLVPENYLFRQEPGPENAMATAKIEFKSPFGIYLHDTPEKQMFNYNNRFFSSGCIRVQNMPGLVNWVLNGQDGYNPDKIADMAKTLERLDVTMAAPVQLRVAYLTAWPAPGGTVAFRNDIYQMDGSGFTVGQPMAVGETSPEGTRFVLKPLPRQLPIDAAEAEGSGFFGGHSGKTKAPSAAAPGKTSGLTKPAPSLGVTTSGNTVTQVSDASAKPKGLFDWESYRKQQAKSAKGGAVKDKSAKPKKKKLDAPTSDTSASAAPGNPAPLKKVSKKDPTKHSASCKAGADGKMPDGCKPKAAKASAKPAPDAKPADAKQVDSKPADTPPAAAN